MSNLFSSFDPTVGFFSIELSLNWIAAIIVLIGIPQLYWLLSSQFRERIIRVFNFLKKELKAIFGEGELPGMSYLFIAVFIFILFSNLMGLIPYIFTRTRHISTTLVLALPLWLGRIMWSTVFQLNSLIAHLVPIGTPVALMPVIVIIETVRSIIRPLTLSIRLAANIIAGHLLLTLLGSQGPNLSGLMLRFLFVGLVLLLLLEVAVACIQSYVFTILSSLYLNELISAKFNSKIL